MLRKASEEYSEQKANFEGEISKLKFDHSGEIENLYLENERRLKDLLEKHNKDLKVKLFLMISQKFLKYFPWYKKLSSTVVTETIKEIVHKSLNEFCFETSD